MNVISKPHGCGRLTINLSNNTRVIYEKNTNVNKKQLYLKLN